MRIISRCGFLLGLFLIFGFLVSCTKTEKISNQLVIGQENAAERLDPLKLKDPHTLRIAWQIYEGLVGLDEEGRIVPKLAESWRTEDNKIWTFRIRKDASFHSSEIFGTPAKGRNVTANDILYSYTRFCSPDSYSSFVLADSVKGCAEYNSGKANSVEGLKSIDESTFQIELKKPEAFFLNRITSPWISIFPKEAEQDRFKESWGLKLAVGTGPYILVSKNDNEVVLVRNEKYWDQQRVPKIEKIVFRIIKNDEIRFSELTNNKIDMMVLPNHLFPAVFDQKGEVLEKYRNKFKVKSINTFNVNIIGMNMKQIPDVHLRKAISYGTNREEMVKSVLYGYGEAVGSVVPPGMNGYKSDLKDLYDPVRAKEELKASNYNGKELEVLVHELANSEKVGQIFQKQMNDIGIKIKLVKTDFNSAIGKMVKGDTQLFNMFAEFVFSSPEPLLLNLFSTEKIPIPNVWGYSNAQVDKKFEDLRVMSDRTSALKETADIERMIMEDAPGVFLYRQNSVVIYSDRFKGLKVNGHNHYMLEELGTM